MDIARMIEHQDRLQRESFGLDYQAMTDEQRVEAIRWNVLALTDELHEALAEVGWKPWASSRHVNQDRYVGELVDALHFLMNLFLASGIAPEQLGMVVSNRYAVKALRNAERQAGGYDGVTGKCPGCHRDLAETETFIQDGRRICQCGVALSLVASAGDADALV